LLLLAPRLLPRAALPPYRARVPAAAHGARSRRTVRVRAAAATPVWRLRPSRLADRRADDPVGGLHRLLARRRYAESLPDLPDGRPEHERRPARKGGRATPSIGPRVRRRRPGGLHTLPAPSEREPADARRPVGRGDGPA